jgi:hypothetical protein
MSKSTISTFELFAMFPDQEAARGSELYNSLYEDGYKDAEEELDQ